MKMHYILKASTKAFIVIMPNDELVITPDCAKATQYNTIGEAMKAAANVNSALGSHLVKVESIG